MNEFKEISKNLKLCMGCHKNMHYPEITYCDNGAQFQTVICEQCKKRANTNKYTTSIFEKK